MKSDKIKVKGGRHEKNTILILAMMRMLACSSCFWGFDHDRHGHGDGDRGGYGNHDQGGGVGIKGIPLNAARTERAVFG